MRRGPSRRFRQELGCGCLRRHRPVPSRPEGNQPECPLASKLEQVCEDSASKLAPSRFAGQQMAGQVCASTPVVSNCRQLSRPEAPASMFEVSARLLTGGVCQEQAAECARLTCIGCDCVGNHGIGHAASQGPLGRHRPHQLWGSPRGVASKGGFDTKDATGSRWDPDGASPVITCRQPHTAVR